jgi:hypothetical protein
MQQQQRAAAAGRLSPAGKQQQQQHGGHHASSTGAAGTKRSFQDKFAAMLQQAQEQQITAEHAAQLQDRRSLAVAMLTQGRAQAFVDFFMLSQPTSGSGAATSAGPPQQPHHQCGVTAADAEQQLPWQTLVLLQEQLVRGDAAGRAHDVPGVFDANRTLARHFTQLGSPGKAMFFWKRCLQVGLLRGPGGSTSCKPCNPCTPAH